jgi:hypothetical protein
MVELLAMFRKLDGRVVVDPRRALIASGELAIESRVHVRIAVPDRAAVEQVFEDLGKVSFTSEP